MTTPKSWKFVCNPFFLVNWLCRWMESALAIQFANAKQEMINKDHDSLVMAQKRKKGQPD